MSWGTVAASNYVPMSGTDEVSHGEQLTLTHVGYTALGVSSGQLTVPMVPGRGYFRGDTPLEFVPNQAYVYNNDPSNKGGICANKDLLVRPYGWSVARYHI